MPRLLSFGTYLFFVLFCFEVSTASAMEKVEDDAKAIPSRELEFAALELEGGSGSTCSANYLSPKVCCQQPESGNDYLGHVRTCPDPDAPFCSGYVANVHMGTCTSQATSYITCLGFTWATAPYCNAMGADDYCCVPWESSQGCSDYLQYAELYFSGSTIHAGDDPTAALFPLCAKTYCNPDDEGFEPLMGDCPGNNLLQLSGLTTGECAEACLSKCTCKGFSMGMSDVSMGKSGECILKSDTCSTVTTSDYWRFFKHHAVSCSGSFEQTVNGDCSGNDIPGASYKPVTLQKCAEYCNSNRDCNGFSLGAGGECILKDDICSSGDGSAYWQFWSLSGDLRNSGGDSKQGDYCCKSADCNGKFDHCYNRKCEKGCYHTKCIWDGNETPVCYAVSDESSCTTEDDCDKCEQCMANFQNDCQEDADCCGGKCCGNGRNHVIPVCRDHSHFCSD